MKKKICIITSTRAEYGLLKPLIDKFQRKENIELKILVTGMHLSLEFGLTYKLIEEDGIRIHKKIEILLSSDSPIGIAKSMALGLISFSEYFHEEEFDLAILLGDRFETFSCATALTLCKIPIAHIHGGELTLGAYDDSFRHSITKMSHIHFPSTKEYRKRIIQLGENPSTVFNVGALGIENIKTLSLLSREEVYIKLNLKNFSPYVLLTYHPETLSFIKNNLQELLKALLYFKDLNIIITRCNGDNGGREINSLLEIFSLENSDRVRIFTSLGQITYLSALKYCTFVIGNSSSGIIEAPSFKVPTINIGNRQGGRLQSTSIINCPLDFDSIKNSIELALSRPFKEEILKSINPYEGLNTSTNIVNILSSFLSSKINITKNFYDI